MDDIKEEKEIPKFPENDMGLVRGSVLEALTDRVPYIAKKGSKLPIGWDGKYIRCAGATWGLNDLKKEIEAGFWKIADEVIDLSDENVSQFFAKIVEQRSSSERK
jgi:hypothetical protein